MGSCFEAQAPGTVDDDGADELAVNEAAALEKNRAEVGVILFDEVDVSGDGLGLGGKGYVADGDAVGTVLVDFGPDKIGRFGGAGWCQAGDCACAWELSDYFCHI